MGASLSTPSSPCYFPSSALARHHFRALARTSHPAPSAATFWSPATRAPPPCSLSPSRTFDTFSFVRFLRGEHLNLREIPFQTQTPQWPSGQRCNRLRWRRGFESPRAPFCRFTSRRGWAHLSSTVEAQSSLTRATRAPAGRLAPPVSISGRGAPSGYSFQIQISAQNHNQVPAITIKPLSIF